MSGDQHQNEPPRRPRPMPIAARIAWVVTALVALLAIMSMVVLALA